MSASSEKNKTIFLLLILNVAGDCTNKLYQAKQSKSTKYKSTMYNYQVQIYRVPSKANLFPEVKLLQQCNHN